MLCRVYRLSNAHNLHARPAAAILKQAQATGCQVFVRSSENGEWAEAGVVNLLLAGGRPEIELGAEGARAAELLEAIEGILA